MRNSIQSFMPPSLWRMFKYIRGRWFTSTYSRPSYSQEGEDIVLERFIGDQRTGFYVDIGAHHPARFSNTYKLYKLGWRGINVDAAPGSMALFKKLRPRDINIETAVGKNSEKLTFYVFEDNALNTFEKELATERVGPKSKIRKEVSMTTVSLAELLDKYLPANTPIDILSVDVEGFDDVVLQSNDWSRYQPAYILVECIHALTLGETSAAPIYILLSSHGYQIVAKTKTNLIFKKMAPA
jgi:FkbM family methyltransferase